MNNAQSTDTNVVKAVEAPTAEFLELEIRVEGTLLAELGNTMAMIEHLSRKDIKCQIFDGYRAADELDAKILDIFLAYMDKLPDEPLLNHTIKEAELITKSLDPILNGMLNDHDTDHTFMWTNTHSTGTEDERPDAEMEKSLVKCVKFLAMFSILLSNLEYRGRVIPTATSQVMKVLAQLMALDSQWYCMSVRMNCSAVHKEQ
ncbi:hypothetical protein G6F42_011987 [Rhizopus arrhizus]|nr:hypothetical protein G6F42_011987 [Rhizopus arrhizus]